MRATLTGLREVQKLMRYALLSIANELAAAQQAMAALDLTELEDMQRRLNELVAGIAEVESRTTWMWRHQ